MDRVLNVISNTSRWSAVMGGVLAFGVLWIWLSSVPASETTAGRVPSPRKGFLAPDFTLLTLDGDPLTLSELRGRAVVINLWASWCPPCRAEMPALQRVFEANEGRGLMILAVNTTYQDRADSAATFVRQHELTFPVLLDMTGSVSNRYLLRALPSTFFVDREGVIQEVVIGGPMSEATIRSGVEVILRGGDP